MDNKTSLLIPGQLPEFVRDEYPLFVAFLEAYYEFLENKQGTNNNDLLSQVKNLKLLFDVDESIDEFEQYFFNTFASLIPFNVQTNKSSLIKNILPLYQSKGSEKSFKLLFRFLFGEEATIFYPKNNILRTSDGKWKVEKSIKASTYISSYYTADGNTNEFTLIGQVNSSDIDVYIDNVLVNSNFTLLKKYSKIIFNSNLAANSLLQIYYNSFEKDIFNNRKLTGESSGASTIVEKTYKRYLNNREILELFVDDNQTLGQFDIGEMLLTDIFVGEDLVNIKLQTVSEISRINILNPGGNYNIGDPIIITAPGSVKNPEAIVSQVSKGSIESITILDGGSGFKVGAPVSADGLGKPFVDIDVTSVRTTSGNSVNTLVIFSDVISDINLSNVLTVASYGLSGTYKGNLNSVIRHTFSNTTFTGMGEVIGIELNSTQISFASQPDFVVEAANLIIANIGNTVVNTKVYVNDFGTLGKIIVTSGGLNYNVRDQIFFTNKSGSLGVGAEAEVSSVNALGSILKVEFVPTRITGTVNVFTTNANVIGTSTSFTSDLIPGDKIMVKGETRVVVTVPTNTLLTVNNAFTANSSNSPIRLYGNHIVGGQGFTQDKLPNVNIVSTTGGTGANVVILGILGSGADFSSSLGDKSPGAIESVTILESGIGLESLPEVDLTGSGDGTAVAEAVLIPTLESFPGKWISQDGILSSSYMKLQGKDYYIDYSYVISSQIEFSKYKKIFRELLHPAGMIQYSEISKIQEYQLANTTVESENYVTTAQPNMLQEYKKISVGGSNSFAIKSNGTLWGWGRNNFGQLGDGTTISKSSPVQIGSSSWTAVAAGTFHTLAIRSDGRLFAWGYNGSGILGDGTSINRSSPVQIGSSSWTAVSAGESYNSLAIRSDGMLFAWGSNNFGQTGDGTTILRSSPVQIGSSSWTFIATGVTNGGAIRSDGMLFAWGNNTRGQLGDNTSIGRSSPVQIGSSSWTMLALGRSNAAAIRSDGALFTWGASGITLLGDKTGLSTTIGRSSPVLYGTDTWRFVSISENFLNTTLGSAKAIKNDYTLWTWGSNTKGQQGTGSLNTTPVQVGNFSWKTVATGYDNVLGVVKDYWNGVPDSSILYVWGSGSYGKLGLSSTDDTASPTLLGNY